MSTKSYSPRKPKKQRSEKEKKLNIKRKFYSKARVYKQKELKEENSEFPNCNRCSRKIIGDTPFCLKHWCSVIRNRIANNTKLPVPFNVMDLWKEQEGKCSISGVELIPGCTASLDHILPLCKGGNNERVNLRFVHIALNGFKNSYTESEFKDLLKVMLPKLQEFIDKE